jgi:hypothetical protein
VLVHLARHEVADDEVAAIEDLVHRWRLVQPTGDRLEVADVKDIRIQASAPADDVEQVVWVGVDRAGYSRRPVAPVLDVNLCRFTAAGAGVLRQQQSLWSSHVTFAVGSMLEELAYLLR